MNKKQEYINFCKNRKDLSFFVQPNWLDIVSDNWDIALYKQENKILAFLPYCIQNKKGFKISNNPPLTPYLGIWIEHPKEIKEVTRLGNEKEVFQYLQNQLPKFDDWNYNFHPEFNNWYPFYLEGFTQTTRYTYCINQPFDILEVFQGFKSKLKGHLKKAEVNLDIEISSNINELIKLKNKAKINNPSIPIFDTNLYSSIFNLCKKDKVGIQLIAKNKEDKTIAAILLVWDTKFCYLLHGASDPVYKKLNAMSLLIWEAIKIADTKKLSLNFEGSMVETVEQYFRFFNATQTPYFNISKTNSKILKFKNFIKSL